MFLKRQILINFYKFFDLLVLIISFAMATWFTYYGQPEKFSFQEFLSIRIKVQNLILFSALLFGWQLIFTASDLYHSKRLSSNRVKESKDVLKATTLATFLLFLSSRLFDMVLVKPLFFLIFWTSSSMICILSRYGLRKLLEWLRLKGRNLRFMLIVGTNERAQNFAKKIEEKPELGYQLLGFVDDEWEGNGKLYKSGWRIVADIKSFKNYIKKKVVDEVIIALPFQSLYREAFQIFSACEEQGVIVRSISDLYYNKNARSKTEYFQGVPVVIHYTGCIHGWGLAIKRLLDIVISGFLLVIVSPIVFISAVAIKIDSPGPVIFVQERVGHNKRKFKIYKLRTMVNGADKKQCELENLNEMCGPVFKIKNDPRITRIGKILRKNSIDEIPQLFNVLKGDMSLVGPRPLPLRDYNGFSEDRQRRRFSVRPGITCLWQVNGRSNTSFDKWMELDIKYIDNWSIWLDLKILMKTIPVVAFGFGAT